MRRPPMLWLQCRQMTRVFSMTSLPPCECGMMWSTSALLGLPGYSQSIATPHPLMGQRSRPRSSAWALACLATRSHVAVPVLLLAMSYAEAGETVGYALFDCLKVQGGCRLEGDDELSVAVTAHCLGFGY